MAAANVVPEAFVFNFERYDVARGSGSGSESNVVPEAVVFDGERYEVARGRR
jgi:hypothetical protein